jgi:hypothetical protein
VCCFFNPFPSIFFIHLQVVIILAGKIVLYVQVSSNLVLLFKDSQSACYMCSLGLCEE